MMTMSAGLAALVHGIPQWKHRSKSERVAGSALSVDMSKA